MSNNVQFNSCLMVLKDIEEILGVYTIIPKINCTGELLGITDFCNYVVNPFNSLDKETKKKLLSNVAYYLVTLSFADQMCEFDRVSILDFSESPALDSLLPLLLPYLKRENITKDVEDNHSYIYSYLKLLEERNNKCTTSMAYRYLRIFYMLIYCKLYKTAAIIVNFLVDQIFIGEDVDNSIREHLSELLDSRKNLDALNSKYGIEAEEPRGIDKVIDKLGDIGWKEEDEEKVQPKSNNYFDLNLSKPINDSSIKAKEGVVNLAKSWKNKYNERPIKSSDRDNLNANVNVGIFSKGRDEEHE